MKTTNYFKNHLVIINVFLSVSFVIFLMLIAMPPTVKADTDDYLSGMILKNGLLTEVNGSMDLVKSRDYLSKAVFKNTTITFDKGGEMTGGGSITLSEPPTPTSAKYSGTATLSLKGKYAPTEDNVYKFLGTYGSMKDNAVEGTFSMRQAFVINASEGGITRTISQETNLNGTFKGYAYGGDNVSLELIFSGTAYEDYKSSMNGEVSEDTSSEYKISHTARFSSSWSAKKIFVGLVRGTAQMSRNKGKTWLDISDDRPINVRVYDTVKTGPNTRLLIKYTDGSVFRLKSNSKLTILPNGVTLEYGGAYFNLQKQGKLFKVVTPTTVCGVLGTEFDVSVAEDGETAIQLMKGSVEMETNDETIVLKPGDKLVVSETDYTKTTFNYESALEIEREELEKNLNAIDFDLAMENTAVETSDNQETLVNETTTNKSDYKNPNSLWVVLSIVIIATMGIGIGIMKKCKKVIK